MAWFRKPTLGARGEWQAARFLRAAGYRILLHSYRCPLGEIDLVAEQGDFLVFVEVKTRVSRDHGEPWQAVDARKQRQVTRAAVHYIKAHHAQDRPVRFDIIGITWPPGWWKKPTIEHFPDAFAANGPWI
ncbi:MAG: YraN family protein [Planctomycetota bacterium]